MFPNIMSNFKANMVKKARLTILVSIAWLSKLAKQSKISQMIAKERTSKTVIKRKKIPQQKKF